MNEGGKAGEKAVEKGRFGAAFERYLVLRRARNLSPLTLHQERLNHRYFWRFLEARGFAGDELAVTREDLLAYQQHLNQDGILKPNSIRIRVKLLGPFYTEAERQGWIIRSPFFRIPPLPREEPAVFALSVAQMKTLLDQPDLATAKGIRDRTLMELLYSCGLRKAELVGLAVDDFSEDFRELRLTGKGGKEAVLPVGKMAAHFVGFYVRELRPLLRQDGGGLVFHSLKTGRPLLGRWVEKIVLGYGKRLGIKHAVLPHTFRYSVATHLSEEGVDLRLIQTFLRHDNIQTTSRYIKNDFRHLQEVHGRTHPREV